MLREQIGGVVRAQHLLHSQLSFLHPLVNGPASKDNMLEKFLWRVLSCTEMVALLRVNTLWQTIVTEPLRYLTGKSGALADWSMVNSNELLDKVYDLMVDVATDGSTLLSTSLDPFADLDQPKFDEHRRAQKEQTVTYYRNGKPYVYDGNEYSGSAGGSPASRR